MNYENSHRAYTFDAVCSTGTIHVLHVTQRWAQMIQLGPEPETLPRDEAIEVGDAFRELIWPSGEADHQPWSNLETGFDSGTSIILGSNDPASRGYLIDVLNRHHGATS